VRVEVRLSPPPRLVLSRRVDPRGPVNSALREDEGVEVTPSFIRLRKVELSAQKRQSAASKKARGLAAVGP